MKRGRKDNAKGDNQHESSEDDKTRSRQEWSAEEDEAVAELVRIHGSSAWNLIAECLVLQMGDRSNGRRGKQIRERWCHHIDPSLSKSAWSEEEERILAEAQRELGTRWSEIAKRLPGRSDNHVKNHWYSFMRREARKQSKEGDITRSSSMGSMGTGYKSGGTSGSTAEKKKGKGRKAQVMSVGDANRMMDSFGMGGVGGHEQEPDESGNGEEQPVRKIVCI